MFLNYSLLPFPVCVLDENLTILDTNSSWDSTLIRPDTKKLNLLSLIDRSTDPGTLLNEIKKAKGTPKSISLTFNLLDANSQSIPFLWGIVYDAKKDQYILCGQNQSNNEAIEAKYERMYQTTSDAIMLLGEEKFTDCNKATLDLFKLNSVEDFIKLHPADLSPPFQPDGSISVDKADLMIKKVIKEGRNFFEWTHRNSLGEDFPCEVLLSLINIHGKKYVQASVRNISERVRFQKELDEARIQQMNAARLASLGEMAGGIAHEINNPMAIIRSQTELLLNSLARHGEIEKESLQKGLERIITTSDRISRIIKGLKLISRDSSDDPLISTNLVSLINETIGMCEERLRDQQIDFKFESEEAELFVPCRSAEIAQVILNLLNNSVDAIAGRPNRWIKIFLSRGHNQAVIKVVDSGEGIPFDIADKITLPFYTTKEVGKGTGLGLSITKRIIEKHKGEFYLDFAASNTTFVIRLSLI